MIWFFLILFFGLGIWVITNMEKWAVNKIRKDATKRKMTVLSIREPKEQDGHNPFGEINIWIGSSSHILGFSGERVYNKIVVIDNNVGKEQYWVKVKTTFFIPSEIQWQKLP